MGACCSKNTTALTPAPTKSDHQQPQNTTNELPVFKKEIFVVKHRVSHEIDRHSDQGSDKNPSATSGTGARMRTSSCSKEEVDSILEQCDRLSRSNSAGARNPRRRYSRSKTSFDLGANSNASASNNDDNDAEFDVDDAQHRLRHRQPEIRVSSGRRISISPNRRSSSSKERRISISPSRRSESPFRVAASGGSSNRPAKMVSVPATDKSNNAGGQQSVAGPVKRIHVKRNVSPARTHTREESSTREADHRRKSLMEIDNNAARSVQQRDTKRTRKLSRDLDVSAETVFEPSSGPDPSPPSYASLLLEDIHNFHKKNANANSNAVTTQTSFALPECVSKACLIMEAVADLNSSTSSLCSDDRWRKPTKDSSGT